MIKKVCDKCGSENVKFDAWSVWNVETQEYDLAQTFDYTWCDDCECECNIIEVEI